MATPGLSHMKSLEIIRRCEIDIALKYFPAVTPNSDCQILEVGAGTGQQAKYLSGLGYAVSAIDLPSSSYSRARVFPIVEYDGKNIPAGDQFFDVVFSSNVLEHVVEIDDFLADTYRVLQHGGMAIHIIPSPTCRIWSIPAHYGWLARRIFAKLKATISYDKVDRAVDNTPKMPGKLREWVGTFLPLRHGERGNTLTEVYYFSKRYWIKKFEEHGFQLKHVSTNGIFYTMANVMGPNLPLSRRRQFAKIFGSSCIIYVVGKSDNV